MNLRELAEGSIRGQRLEGRPGQEVLDTWRKIYVDPPEVTQQLQQNREAGKRPGHQVQGSGGFRLVYREMRVQDKPTLLVAAFGRRENHEAYEVAAQRIVKAQEEQRMRQQATQAAALPRQATRKLPRSTPAPGAPPTSGPMNKPRRSPRL